MSFFFLWKFLPEFRMFVLCWRRSGCLRGGEPEVPGEDALQRPAASSEQAGRCRRHEEEPAGQVRHTNTLLQPNSAARDAGFPEVCSDSAFVPCGGVGSWSRMPPP